VIKPTVPISLGDGDCAALGSAEGAAEGDGDGDGDGAALDGALGDVLTPLLPFWQEMSVKARIATSKMATIFFMIILLQCIMRISGTQFDTFDKISIV
jgi:hypothetical protein